MLARLHYPILQGQGSTHSAGKLPGKYRTSPHRQEQKVISPKCVPVSSVQPAECPGGEGSAHHPPREGFIALGTMCTKMNNSTFVYCFYLGLSFLPRFWEKGEVKLHLSWKSTLHTYGTLRVFKLFLVSK